MVVVLFLPFYQTCQSGDRFVVAASPSEGPDTTIGIWEVLNDASSNMRAPTTYWVMFGLAFVDVFLAFALIGDAKILHGWKLF